MGERKTGPKEVVLLKRWENWSDGIGHLVDEPRINGMYYAAGILGLQRELRPAPFFNAPTMGIGFFQFVWTPASATDAAAVIAALEPVDNDSTVAFDAESSGQGTSTTVTISHTCTGSDLCLIVGVSVDNAVPTGVTYNSVAMTKIADQDASAGNASLWRLVGPATGANDIVVTVADSDEIVAGGQSFTKVHQTLPITDFNTKADAASTLISFTTSSFTRGAGVGVFKGENVSVPVNDGTESWNLIEGTAVRGVGVRQMTPGGTESHFQFFFEEEDTSGNPFLYAMRGPRAETAGKYLHKISLAFSDFGEMKAGNHRMTTGLPGQPAKYQTDWYIPAGSDQRPYKLDVVGTGDVSTDTFVDTTGSFTLGSGDQYGNLGFQLIAVVEGAGTYILTLDGNPSTASDWGSAFQTGDKNIRPIGLKSLQGLSFVLTEEGLFSFNNKGNSRLIFEDFRDWRTSFSNTQIKAWHGRLVILHPSGLLLYAVGEDPINIGLETKTSLRSVPPSGVTELHGGIYNSVAIAGTRYIYSFYQPRAVSASALILVAYPKSDDPTDLIWQCLGTGIMSNSDFMMGCHLAASGLPLNTSATRPSLWFGVGGDLEYVVLDEQASPFRSRADTHRVNVLADAYMSEIIFPEPVDITDLIVHTSSDMVSGDEFQISLLVNGSGGGDFNLRQGAADDKENRAFRTSEFR
ncbi:hypothetical protein LCGC14_1830540 [marine sediment metagenome]|uniref:Uncharacterized protein n=1 Tax=marine sediment metagenome TaxID=412755 RepID=A0A0F9IVT8_9ZZZZ